MRQLRTFRSGSGVLGLPARRPSDSKPLRAIFGSCASPSCPLHPNLTRVGGLVVPGCGSDCTYRVLGIVTDSGTSKTNQPEWVAPAADSRQILAPRPQRRDPPPC